jgi:hypothetical protein
MQITNRQAMDQFLSLASFGNDEVSAALTLCLACDPAAVFAIVKSSRGKLCAVAMAARKLG